MNEMFDVLNEYGEFTGIVKDRDTCHKEGLWHRAVVVFIINSKGDVLLQKRSATKKVWPNLWDISAGGHVLSGELGFQTAIRETKEEIGIDIKKEELLSIGGTTSNVVKEGMIDKHYNEYFVVYKDVNIADIKLQKEEVSDIKWFAKEEFINKINNNYEDLTGKYGLWEYLKVYFEYVK